jgi:diaminopimelate epimerase
MMRSSYTKAHGARNDFLLTWPSEAAPKRLEEAAMLRGLVESPVRVVTPGGPLEVRWDETVYMTGPAEIIGRSEYY